MSTVLINWLLFIFAIYGFLTFISNIIGFIIKQGGNK